MFIALKNASTLVFKYQLMTKGL